MCCLPHLNKSNLKSMLSVGLTLTFFLGSLKSTPWKSNSFPQFGWLFSKTTNLIEEIKETLYSKASVDLILLLRRSVFQGHWQFKKGFITLKQKNYQSQSGLRISINSGRQPIKVELYLPDRSNWTAFGTLALALARNSCRFTCESASNWSFVS